MKTLPQNYRAISILVGLALTAQTASAFYNPNTGRWLNRDPIEERGGTALYLFVNNQPVLYHDRLGLSLGPIEIDPPEGRVLEEHDGYQGQTWSVWTPTARVVRTAPDGPCCYHVATGGGAVVSWWYSLGNPSRGHEYMHVGDWIQVWDSFRAEADSYEDICMTHRRADCFARVITSSMKDYYYLDGKVRGAHLDCETQGGIYCQRLAEFLSHAAAAGLRLISEIERCQRIP